MNEVIQALSVLTKTYKGDNGKAMTLFEHAKGKFNNKRMSESAERGIEEWKKFQQYLDRKLYPMIRSVCLACAEISNDDNPSNRGQTFISMDATSYNSIAATSASPAKDESGNEAEGGDGAEEDDFFSDMDDEEVTAKRDTGNYLHKNAIPQSTSGSEDGVTKMLPLPVEDKLRELLAGFSQLSTIEKNLLFHQMVGQSLENFASMNWVSPEMKKRQSKQWAWLKWQGLVSKFPLANVLRDEKPLKGTTDQFNRQYGPDYAQDEFALFEATPIES